jgi:hypothetical protein
MRAAPWQAGLVKFGRPLSAAIGVAVVAGCTSSASTQSDAGSSDDGSDIVGCQSDPRVDTYSPGLTKPGQAKVFKFVLVSADPAPPAQYLNTWVLKIEDSAGNPVTGATITSITPFMPDHGHGTSVPQIATNPDGTITVSSIYLFMLGVWRTTIVARAGSTTDAGVFWFCIS